MYGIFLFMTINKQEIIAQLKKRIDAIEWPSDNAPSSYAIGINEIDDVLRHGGL
jgi:hypothetical protein